MRLKLPTAGQALVEFVLAFPLFMIVLFTVIVLGLYVFYNQQLENAAREAARYAAVHSASAQCPTVSRLDPVNTLQPASGSYHRCDAPEDGWPRMVEAGRNHVWGMAGSQVSLSACWSGLVDGLGNADALPGAGTFTECTIGGVNPRRDPDGLACPPPPTSLPSAPFKADGDDKASATAAVAAGAQQYPTTITVYACFVWTPPMSGFLFVPAEITLRAVITEALQRQQ